MNTKPFIHKFTGEKGTKKYIYCVNTNRIMQVDDIIYDIIDYTDNGNEHAFPQGIIKKYRNDALQNVTREVVEARDKIGFAGMARPSKMTMKTGYQEYKDKLFNEMKMMTLNVTNDCNMKCTYCAYGALFRKPRKTTPAYMTTETAMKAVDLLINNSGNSESISLGFYGGEPFLNFKIMERTVEYFRDRNAKYNKKKAALHITTNGTVLNDEMIKWFIDNDVNVLVSLDGPKSVHDRYRVFKNGSGSFCKIIKNLSRVKEMNEDYYNRKISFNIVIAPPNEYKKIYEFLAKNRSLINNNVHCSYLNYDDYGYFKNINNKYDTKYTNHTKYILNNYFKTLNNCFDKDKYKELILEHLHKIDFKQYVRRKIRKNCENIIINGICEPGIIRSFVLTDGSIYPCEQVRELPYLEIGNVYKGFYKNGTGILKGYEIVKAFIEIINNECVNCWAYRFCTKKTCLNSATGRKGFSQHLFNKTCTVTRNMIERELRIYMYYENRYPEMFNELYKRPQ